LREAADLPAGELTNQVALATKSPRICGMVGLAAFPPQWRGEARRDDVRREAPRTVCEMSDGLNEGVVGDTAKLMMHRLIVRRLRHDPSLVDKAKVAHARQAAQFADWPFVREWQDLLALPAGELASKLISRDREMVRLRNSSPFYLAEGVHFGDYDMRVRLRRAARRVVQRGLSAQIFPVMAP
jgi:hypothetical protein